MHKTLRSSLSILIVSGLCATACAASTEDDSTTGDGTVGSSDANVVIATDQACNLVAFYASGNPEVKRALDWAGAKVPYSKSITRGSAPYRADCSGLVSHAWQLPTAGGGPDTSHLAPYNDTYSTPLASWEDLQAGDALNFHGNGHGHVMLFVGWVDASHKDFCTLEEFATGKPASVVRHGVTDPASHWGGGPNAGTMIHTYLPIRKAGD